MTCNPIVPTPQRSKRKVQLYDMRAPNIDKLQPNCREDYSTTMVAAEHTAESIKDQYAYKITGSTTAALVHFVHRVTRCWNIMPMSDV